jgi:hypothetical protein
MHQISQFYGVSSFSGLVVEAYLVASTVDLPA